MSGPVTNQALAGIQTIPASSVTDAHANGHLVMTGRDHNIRGEPYLFIHTAAASTTTYYGLSFSYDGSNRRINNRAGTSPGITMREHGWFTDVAMLQQIAMNHPIPNGQVSKEVFIGWRDSLLEFLDTNHRGVGGQWTPIT
ncbi:hypothetical protein DE146DRAFT_773188 [Phaeosphaeria sp. MPI-PUGE-AT-0046c]|nr:hypothetical protein DE146DRAFT_773188 [Phaeosphaeria sp. MPI-PUGE-AT-0046c]